MRVLVSGASGLIGGALVPFLESRGHEVVRLVRRAPAAGGREAGWDPAAGRLDPTALEGVEAAVHLAGESIAERWTPDKRARIRDSRVGGTRLLAETLAGLPRPPGVLVSASAIGIYGDRGDEILTEASPPGTGFLAGVARDWEAAAEPARRRGIRVVHPRIGIALTTAGGALARLLPPFRMGVGGKLGSGRQYMSWIALDDLLAVLDRLVGDASLAGPVNAVAPRPVTNAEFAKTLGRVLGRPTFLGAPAGAARAAFGEMADEVLLASQRVAPARLLDAGFPFRHPDLEGALRHLLRR